MRAAMMKRLPALVAISVLIGVSGCAPEHSALDLPPGTYQHDVKSTDANGVTTEKRNTTNVGVDANGRKTAVVESKTTEKPPGFFNGLFNKTTTNQSRDVIQEQ
jgi:hypothetical protein